ncbi:MAG: permease prefix domain 1-containing protein [Alicyclobacillus macrosporangiidus]|uniref:permease prefix domain 1-containing protein n=1 Tax=Alicyclobacillus macrosporangiidus TaxID=392015 RepID=UPI0026F0648A|nr:permease prefix domain 1-containing protein [Alicyclobacillus macrosporangiidus]MCL6599418.1 permease prefix domain 1-containing protein [Alicyclobacillus macrosporangiidus]
MNHGGEIEEYLWRLVRGAGLSRREQLDWVAEMRTHLEEDIHTRIAAGAVHEEAVAAALRAFGSARRLRRQVARETFGATRTTLFSAAAGFFLLFLVSVWALHAGVGAGVGTGLGTALGGGAAMTGPDAATGSGADVWMRRVLILLSPSLMLSLCLGCLWCLKTRSRRDRMAIGLVIATFAALWLIQRATHHWGVGAVLTFYDLRPVALAQPAFAAGCLLLFAMGLAVYAATRNRWLSIFPIALSLALGSWAPPSRNSGVDFEYGSAEILMVKECGGRAGP